MWLSEKKINWEPKNAYKPVSFKVGVTIQVAVKTKWFREHERVPLIMPWQHI